MKEFLHFERMKCFSTHVQMCLLLTTFPPPICSIFLALSSHTLTTVSRISPLGKKHYILSTPNIILSIIKLFENIVYCFFHLLTPTLYPSIHCNLVLLFLHFNFFLKILDLHIAKYNKLFTNSLSRLPYYNIGNVFSRNSLLPCLLWYHSLLVQIAWLLSTRWGSSCVHSLNVNKTTALTLLLKHDCIPKLPREFYKKQISDLPLMN